MAGIRKAIIPTLMALLSSVSCTNEGYETGDGKYSYLCTEFVDAYTSADTLVTRVVTDDDETLGLLPNIRPSWVTRPDTVYRGLLYYNKVGNPVKAFSLAMVPVLRPAEKVEQVVTDPVGLESVWASRNGRYVNIGLLLKTGVPDSVDARQWISVMRDSDYVSDQTGVYAIRLLHGQNGVPEYYTSRFFVSIPVDTLPTGHRVRLRVNTYDGEVVREIIL